MRCKICGELHSLDEGKIIKGSNKIYFVCDDCKPDNYSVCTDCGKLEIVDNGYYTYDNRFICNDCYCGSYFICDKCGEVHDEYDMISVNNGEYCVCDDCADRYYYRCDDCGSYYTMDNVHIDSNDTVICIDCFDNYYICEDCGCFVHYDDVMWVCDFTYCDVCYNEHTNKTINQRHSTSNWEVYGEANDYDNNNVTIGLEIEVDGDNTLADEFMEVVDNDLIYLEHDGSVEGFEIITQPMTKSYATKEFSNVISKGLDFLKKNKFKGHNYGGIHIHVGRLNDRYDYKQVLLKLKHLLYNLDNNKQKLLLLISQRKRSELSSWSDNHSSYMSLQNCFIQSSRYELLNNDERTWTLEFRMFNSNLRIERIMKNIEVVYSLIDYVDTYYTTDMYNHSLFTWMRYVKNNAEKYPNLNSFIDEIQDKIDDIKQVENIDDEILA